MGRAVALVAFVAAVFALGAYLIQANGSSVESMKCADPWRSARRACRSSRWTARA
jgi:hypothetical protein